VSFFQSSAKIYSDEDLRKIREEERLMQLQEQLRERTWSKTLKRQKEVLIETYIYELKKKYSLGIEEGKKLEDLINIGLLYNYFNKDNIILEDGMISDIKGLQYNETKGEFTTITEMKPKTNMTTNHSGRPTLAAAFTNGSHTIRGTAVTEEIMACFFRPETGTMWPK